MQLLTSLLMCGRAYGSALTWLGLPLPLLHGQVRRVLDVIRGRTYEDALLMMEYMPYKACEKIIKLLVSVGGAARWHLQGVRLLHCAQAPAWLPFDSGCCK